MRNTKFILTLILLLGLLFAQVGSAAAAPAQDTTPITGTITSVTCETDSAGTNTFLVTFDGTTTVRIDQQTAIDLTLVSADGNGDVDCTSPNVLGELQADEGRTDVSIDPSTVIPDQTEEEPVNIISSILADFFGADAQTIDSYHNDGFGFGLIAQALWMSKNVSGDISFDQILQAKKDGSGTFTLSDGTEITYTNWGQFRKALLSKKQNLGVVVSGHGDSTNEHGNGQGNGNGNGQGNNNGQGNGNGNGQGNNNGNGHGNGQGNGNNGNGHNK